LIGARQRTDAPHKVVIADGTATAATAAATAAAAAPEIVNIRHRFGRRLNFEGSCRSFSDGRISDRRSKPFLRFCEMGICEENQ
jgi:hypothetical protein